MLHSLGSGTQASVRLARRDGTEELFALKAYVKPPAGGDPVGLRRELRILQSFRHPGVVRLEEHFETRLKSYLVLEHCGGQDLQRYLSLRGGRLAEAEVRGIAGTILRTLFFLHSQGVVHRDLKPANVLLRDILRPAETLCLADFGSAYIEDEGTPPTEPPRAKFADGSDDGSQSTESFPSPMIRRPSIAFSPTAATAAEGLRTLAGTPYYLAPEIVAGRPYDSGVDLWSLGCIIYQLLFGRTPFELVASFSDLYRQILAAEIDFPDASSPALRSFLAGLLHPDPSRRLSSSDALAHPWMNFEEGAGGLPEVDRAGSDGWLVHLNELGELELSDVSVTAGGDSGYGSAKADSLCDWRESEAG
ncbi:kinase-like domain-containing protein [Hyaloraphidium curvatum]|nr:kinase-like domain-containing protein [Hyaloraphidium curvatum]